MAYELLVTDQICGAGGGMFTGWQMLTGAALLFSVAIIVFLYLVNRFFQNSEGAAWCKLELYEVFVTVVIIFVVAAAADQACRVNAQALFPASSIPSGYNIYQGAAYYLDEFSTKLMYITTSMYAFYCWLDPITSMTFTGRPLGIGTAIQPTSGFAATIKPGMTNAFNILVIGYIMNKVQIFLVDFFAFGFLKYYLPLGVILRSFAPTRRIGGTVIAIALGFLFVYPFLTIMEGEFGLNALEVLSDDFIPGFWSEIARFSLNEFGNIVELFTKAIFELDVFNLLGKLVYSTIGAIAFGLLYLSASAASYAFLVGLFFPAFNTLILVTTIRYLSKSMGEEMDVTNLTRLI